VSAFDTDVLVIGGGPAGLAAAIAARRKGFRVILADAATPPIDKACGEGLMPDAMRALAELGVSLPSSAAGLIRGIRFIGHGVAGDPVSVVADFPSGPAAAVRRTVLHQALVATAARAGVEIYWGAAATALTERGAIVADRELTCRWLVGADGAQSRVRRWAGLDRWMKGILFKAGKRYGFRLHFRLRPWMEHVEVYWRPDFQLYLTPTGPEEVCVAVLTRDPRLRVAEALEYFPEIAERLASAPQVSTERGGISANRKLWVVSQGSVALIGDASGSVDAITGEGLGLAFRQALALAGALQAGNLDVYETAHRRLIRRPMLMARLLLLPDGSPELQARVLSWLGRRPLAFRVLLAFHVGELFPRIRIGSGRRSIPENESSDEPAQMT
jgi:flavin-dependent dehydrogenase